LHAASRQNVTAQPVRSRTCESPRFFIVMPGQ
jgi:hypothetical protein